jgi:hypothetical protein
MSYGANNPNGLPLGLPSIVSLGLAPGVNPYPALDLDFINNQTLDSRITFTRASSATFFDQLGVLQTAASGAARFTYDPATLQPQGLLIEEQRTNLLLRSEELNEAAWVKVRSSVTANTAIAPSGNLTADKLVENTDTNTHEIYQAVTVAANTLHVATFYLKAAERFRAKIWLLNGAVNSGANASVNLTAGTITSPNIFGTGASAVSSITNVGNGWYRCAIGCIIDAASTTARAYVVLENATGNDNYTGDGTSGVFIWGAQLEAGAFPTSYIPTTTTALTRNADVASMTGTNFSSWYNASEGTLYVEGVGVNNVGAGTRRYAEINDNTPSERILVGYGFTTACRYLVSDGGATQADIGVNATTGGALVKAAATYKVNDFQQATNGVLGTADTSGTLPTVDRMFIGQAETTTAATMLNGTIRSIRYYAARLPDAQLVALTG